MTNQPHRPSSMCVDTCDNPYVCADEFRMAELQAENERLRAAVDGHAEATRHWIKQAHDAQAEVARLRAALLGITQCLGEGACNKLNCPGCQHEMREAADLARAALAQNEDRNG